MATDIDSCRRKCTRIFILLNLCVYCFSRGDDLRSEDSIRWVKAGECFSKAVESIEMRCKDMNTGIILCVILKMCDVLNLRCMSV